MQRRRRILYLRNIDSLGAVQDGEILREVYEVREIAKGSTLQRLGALAGNIFWADAVLSHFASLQALAAMLLARMLGKKAAIAIGGYDCASLPELDYGHMRPGPMRPLTRLTMLLADRLMPVSQFAYDEAVRNAEMPPAKLTLVAHGFRPVPEHDRTKERMVLTVGVVNHENLDRKGMRAFLEVARLLPDVPFVLAGRTDPAAEAEVKPLAGPNVRVTGYISDEERDELYRRATVYVQLSAHEAFGLSVAEAMMNRCVPVVSDRGSLPEVVSRTGIVVPLGDARAAAEAIASALERPELGFAARARILETYSYERRRDGLLGVFEELLGKTAPPAAGS